MLLAGQNGNPGLERELAMKQKTILVTGSSGLIGSEAVEHFDRQDTT